MIIIGMVAIVALLLYAVEKSSMLGKRDPRVSEREWLEKCWNGEWEKNEFD